MDEVIRRATVAHNVVHLRAAPKSGAELVSQTLGGQTVDVLREQDGWAWVQTDDAYRGWADLRWLGSPEKTPPTIVFAPFADVRTEPDPDAPLVERLSILCGYYPGTKVDHAGDGNWQPATLPGQGAAGWLDTRGFHRRPPSGIGIGEQVIWWGREFRGTPYLWGGSSAFGLDCSGLVQLCYRLCGVILRRDADIQRDDPRFVPVAQTDLVPGDLVFFGGEGKITHVGMHCGDNMFIHSAGGAGVILTPWGDDRYSPTYVDARRLDSARAHEPVTRFEALNR